jgi:hypothetical protein
MIQRQHFGCDISLDAVDSYVGFSVASLDPSFTHNIGMISVCRQHHHMQNFPAPAIPYAVVQVRTGVHEHHSFPYRPFSLENIDPAPPRQAPYHNHFACMGQKASLLGSRSND